MLSKLLRVKIKQRNHHPIQFRAHEMLTNKCIQQLIVMCKTRKAAQRSHNVELVAVSKAAAVIFGTVYCYR